MPTPKCVTVKSRSSVLVPRHSLPLQSIVNITSTSNVHLRTTFCTALTAPLPFPPQPPLDHIGVPPELPLNPTLRSLDSLRKLS